MFLKLKILITSLAILISGATYADLAIITHPDTDTGAVDTQSARRLFLGERKSFPSGLHATPVNHIIGSPDRKEFFSLVLNMPESRYKRHWKRKISTGTVHTPAELKSYKEVLRSIANTPGSIGYIDAGKVNDTVKVLMIVSGFKGV